MTLSAYNHRARYDDGDCVLDEMGCEAGFVPAPCVVEPLGLPPGCVPAEWLGDGTCDVLILGQTGQDKDGRLLGELLDELGTTAAGDAGSSHGSGLVDVNVLDGKYQLGIYAGHSTALHHAAKTGYVSAIAVLTAHGANVNAKATDGQTPVAVAQAAGHHAVVDALVAAGAKSRIEKGRRKP